MKKIIEDFGPLLVFFILNSRGAEWLGMAPEQSLFIATAGFMAALLIVIIFTLLSGRRPTTMSLVSGGFVMVFGGLTLYLQDETFIKVKPTIVYCLFAGILGFGLMRRVSYLKNLMGDMLPMDKDGWMILTRRWVGFFIAMAVLNEILWRTLTTDQWVQFKVFGFLIITLVFSAAQVPLFSRHSLNKNTEA